MLLNKETKPNQRLVEKNWKIGYKRTSGDYPNCSIIKIGQNTEKSPGRLRGLSVIETPVRNYWLMLVE